MPKYDAKAELETLNDELLHAYERLFGCEKEAKKVIKQQILEIKRDIKRNSMKIEEKPQSAIQEIA